MADAREALTQAGAYARPALLVSLHDNMTPQLWLRLVGEFWSVSDGDRSRLSALLLSFDDWHPMMDADEARAWAALPCRFVAWRGCHEGVNEAGLSYSLERDTARQFPFMARYRNALAQPLLIRALVDRANCILKQERGEVEVLAARVQLLSWNRLPDPWRPREPVHKRPLADAPAEHVHKLA